MGKIKKILENELVGGTQTTDVYPVTSVKAVYDENNERLDNIIKRRGIVNVSTNYNEDHIPEVLTLSQAINKVPTEDRILGSTIKVLTVNGWMEYEFVGDSIEKWNSEDNWKPAYDDRTYQDRYPTYACATSIGYPILDYNHLANFDVEGAFIGYIQSSTFDAAWLYILPDTTSIIVEGAIRSFMSFYSSLIPTTDSYLGGNLTPDAKLCIINFRKSDNPSGYSNLKITQEDGSFASILRMKNVESSVTNVDNLQKMIYLGIGSGLSVKPNSKNWLDNMNVLEGWTVSEGNWIELNGAICSGKLFLKNNTVYRIKGVHGYGTNESVTNLAYFDNEDNYIGRSLLTLKSDLTSVFSTNLPDNCAYQRLVLKIPSMGEVSIEDTQISQGDIDIPIEAFKGYLFTYDREFENQSKEEYVELPKGKNYINPDDLLYGQTIDSGLIKSNTHGILSNRLFLEDGETYTISNVPVYNLSLSIRKCYIANYDKMGNYLNRSQIDLTMNEENTYGNATFKYSKGDCFYSRLLVQSSSLSSIYNPATLQLEKGANATSFEEYKGTIYKSFISNNQSFNLGRRKNLLMTGASLAFPDNKFFSYVCNNLGIVGYNKAIPGETIVHTAQKMHDGTLYTKEEFEDFDILIIFHSHNQTVNDTSNIKSDYDEYQFPLTDKSACWDYVLKKYAAECYAAKDDPESKWYGTKCGKPFEVIACTHWHDARTIFNESIRELQKKWGFKLCEFDKNIGFSKNQVHPITGEQVSVLHTDNVNPTEVIDGVTYGWHQDRAEGSYIQYKMASILEDVIIGI